MVRATDGKKIILTTRSAFESIYRDLGFKLAEAPEASANKEAPQGDDTLDPSGGETGAEGEQLDVDAETEIVHAETEAEVEPVPTETEGTQSEPEAPPETAPTGGDPGADDGKPNNGTKRKTKKAKTES